MYWLKSLPMDIPRAEWTREEDEEVLALEKKYFGRWEDVPYALSHTPYECDVRCFELSQPHFRDCQSISVKKKNPPPKIVMLPAANSAAKEPTPGIDAAAKEPTPGIDAAAMEISLRDAWESIFNRKKLAKEFVVDGTASESPYGACESMYTPQMVPGELFDPISQALQASVDRDCLNDVRARPHLVESTCGSRDLQMVKIGLRVLTRPLPDMLPTVYRTLGENCNERVLPSIIHETLKAVVAQYNASQLLTQREAVSREIRKVLTERAANFNIALDDVSITMLTFGWEFTQAIEAKQVAAQEAERAKFTVEKAEQDKKSAIIRAQGEAKSAQLIGQAIANNPAFVTLRQIESSREIAHTLANASNKILLNSNDLLLNLSDKGGAATATAGKR